MKCFRSACRVAGAAALLLLATGCSSDRAPVRNLAACSVPRVDTVGWVRQAGPYRGFSYRLPPTFREDTRALFQHGGAAWRDGPREFHSINGHWGTGPLRPSSTDTSSSSEHSECWDSIGGLRVFIATGYREGRYTASAWFRDPIRKRFTVGEVLLRGHGISGQDQALFLTIIRTVAPDSAR
jgi:hypothetical protein